jgi:hypothetical protein
VYWILGYPDPPTAGPPQQPIFFSKEQETTIIPLKKTLVRRRLMRRMTSKHRRHKDPPHEAFLMRMKNKSALLARSRAPGKDKTRKRARHPCCPDKDVTTHAAGQLYHSLAVFVANPSPS